jgi:hypothetical protein
MKFPSLPSIRSKQPSPVPPMAYTGPSPNDSLPPTQRRWGGRCVNFSYDSAAILVSFLTLANGIMSLVNGIQWFMAGGSLARGRDAFETAVGAIIDGMSVISLVVLYSRLKVTTLWSLMLENAICGVAMGYIIYSDSACFVIYSGSFSGCCKWETRYSKQDYRVL